MTSWAKKAQQAYAALNDYAVHRTAELSPILKPYIDTTDRYGELICRIVLFLGQSPPGSKHEAAQRDLMADIFDFLYEARHLIIKGKLEIAYPLARRAYESLSLMVACHMEPKLADRWMTGKKIGNGEVRKVLAKHPMGESEELTRDFYRFFSLATHPNRDMVAQRFLGEGNQFVLGAVGAPSLSLLADYALKTLNLWFWFGAFCSFVHRKGLAENDPDFKKDYDTAAKLAQETAAWLAEQFDRVLAQEQAYIAGTSH